MMKRLFFALLTLLFAIVHAAPAQEVSNFARFPLPQEVTFDVSGTFPANYATSTLTASNASFLIEFTVPRFVPSTPPGTPFSFNASIISGSYSFEGKTYLLTGTTSQFGRSSSAGNIEWITIATRYGTLILESFGPFHTPFLSTMYNNKTATFFIGDLGAGTNWTASFTPITTGQSASGPINLTEVVSRLALPHVIVLP